MSHRRGRVQIMSLEDELDNLQLSDIQPAATTTPSSSNSSDSSDPSDPSDPFVVGMIKKIMFNFTYDKCIYMFNFLNDRFVMFNFI